MLFRSGPTLMSRSMSASRLTMVILCMTMSRILRSSDCHLSLAALLKLWLAPFFWNFFLGGHRRRGQGGAALSLCKVRSLSPGASEAPSRSPQSSGARPPHLAGRAPGTVGAGWLPRKWLVLRSHWRTMLETERAPDSASDEVVLADTSAPESSMGDFSPTRPATRSDKIGRAHV